MQDALAADPQHRLLLEGAAQLLSSHTAAAGAGLAADAAKAGVFVSVVIFDLPL